MPFEYLQSLKTWGNKSEDVIPSLRGGGVAVPDWPFTVRLFPTSCTLCNFLPLRATFRHDFSGILPRMRGSQRGHTRLIECMKVANEKARLERANHEGLGLYCNSAPLTPVIIAKPYRDDKIGKSKCTDTRAEGSSSSSLNLIRDSGLVVLKRLACKKIAATIVYDIHTLFSAEMKAIMKASDTVT